MRKTLMFGAAIVILVGCSAPCPTAPIKSAKKVAALQWACPLGNGVVIRTGATEPWEGCEPYFPE